uniref:MAT1-1-3 n=1 Tax=Hymenoscyphus fraxineus TaxID=746836 RepID=K4HDA7_9HELO|nr:MAT1-1-3 [Hymenoscyphus fraxineus]
MNSMNSAHPIQNIMSGALLLVVPEADRTQFLQLWTHHTQLLKQGKFIFFLTEVANNIASILLHEEIYVHYDTEAKHYRLGPIKDQYDFATTSGSLMVYYKEKCPLQAAMPITTMPIINPTSVSVIQREVLRSLPTVPNNASHDASDETASATGKAVKIPKPANAWILYRQSKHRMVADENPGAHTSDICMWKQESMQVKNFWHRKAAHEKAMHALRYPNYRVRPRRSSQIRRRARKVTEVRIDGPMVSSMPAAPTEVQINGHLVSPITSAPQNEEDNEVTLLSSTAPAHLDQGANDIDALLSLDPVYQNDMENIMADMSKAADDMQFNFNLDFERFDNEFNYLF